MFCVGCRIFLVNSRTAKIQFAGEENWSPDQLSLNRKGDKEELGKCKIGKDIEEYFDFLWKRRCCFKLT